MERWDQSQRVGDQRRILTEEDLSRLEALMLRGAVGVNVRTARLAKGLDQMDLARLVNCSNATISHIEQGMLRPKYKTLKLMAAALDVPLEQLYGFSKTDVNRLIGEIRCLWRDLSESRDQCEKFKGMMREARDKLNWQVIHAPAAPGRGIECGSEPGLVESRVDGLSDELLEQG